MSLCVIDERGEKKRFLLLMLINFTTPEAQSGAGVKGWREVKGKGEDQRREEK